MKIILSRKVGDFGQKNRYTALSELRLVFCTGTVGLINMLIPHENRFWI